MKTLSFIITIVLAAFVFSIQAQAQLTLDSSGNVKISGSGNGVVFPDGTLQTTASAPPWHQILPSTERFKLVMENDQAVLDRETGLVWEKSPYWTGDYQTSQMSWYDVCVHCYMREVGGRKGWRLPTIEELASLVDMSAATSPKLPAGHPFVNVQSSYYWSSTTHPSDADLAMHLSFESGNLDSDFKNNVASYGWCVRGGHGHDAY